MSNLSHQTSRFTHESGSPKKSHDDDNDEEQIRSLEWNKVLVDKRHASIRPRTYELKEAIPAHRD